MDARNATRLYTLLLRSPPYLPLPKQQVITHGTPADQGASLRADQEDQEHPDDCHGSPDKILQIIVSGARRRSYGDRFLSPYPGLPAYTYHL
jgi:hypothetical protein